MEYKRVVIGIDPGYKTTGIAVWEVDKAEFTDLHTMDIWATIRFLNKIIKLRGEFRDNNRIKDVMLMIEDPNINKPVFQIASETKDFREAIGNNDEELHNRTLRLYSRRAQNVGMNKQTATFLIDYAKIQGFITKQVRPSKKKLNAKEFKARTGYLGRCSQHARDAASLVFPVQKNQNET